MTRREFKVSRVGLQSVTDMSYAFLTPNYAFLQHVDIMIGTIQTCPAASLLNGRAVEATPERMKV